MERESLDINTLLSQYQEQGYIKLSNFLTKEKVDRLNKAIDEVIDEEPQKKYNYDIRNCVERHPEFAALMDDRAVLPLIVNIFGSYNIQLHLSHLTVKQHNPELPIEQSKKNTVGWHQDGPVPRFPQVGGITPLYYLKICYMLSDLSEPYRGNTKIIPQSGDERFTPVSQTGEEIEGEMQMCGEPGDAFIFPQNLWHAAAPNLSTITRRQLFIGYSYLWMRPLDYHRASDHMLENADPIRRQLLGQISENPFMYYVSRDIKPELPLKSFLLEDSTNDYKGYT
jgi:ectoine hydroxylase-related dioxygenase (phytanoyl-CoA dioxygenase family)